MPPATWTAWKIDAQGNRIEKKGEGSMPAEPFDASVPGTTTVNGTPQTTNNNNTPPPPPDNSNPVVNPVSNSTPAATTPPPPAAPPVDATAPTNAAPVNAAAPTNAAAPVDAAAPPPAPVTPPPVPAAAPPAVVNNAAPAPQAASAVIVPPTSPPPSSVAASDVNGATISDIGTPVKGGGGGSSLSTTTIAIVSSFLVVFVVAAILGAVYLRKRRSKQRLTSVQAAMNVRRSSSADRANMAGFASTNLLKTTPSSKPKTLATKRGMQSHLSLSKIGVPVLIKTTTDQDILDAAIPAGAKSDDALSTSIMLQLGFESVPVSPRANEFGNVPLGEMSESRTSSDHMRIRQGMPGRHTRDPSFDFSRVDPTASMGGRSSNFLVAAPKTVVPRERSTWEDSGATTTTSSMGKSGRSPPPFGSRRF